MHIVITLNPTSSTHTQVTPEGTMVRFAQVRHMVKGTTRWVLADAIPDGYRPTGEYVTLKPAPRVTVE